MSTLQQHPTPPAVPAPPVPTVPNPIAGQVTDRIELIAQLKALQAQVDGLKAQRSALQRQLSSPQLAVRSNASEELVRVESQLARATVDLADVRARLQSHVEIPSTGQPSSPRPGRSMDNDAIIPIASLLIIFVLLPLTIGVVRWMWRRPVQDTRPPVSDTIGPRLDRLEQAVDAIAIEIERIAEGQRFVTKVMVERPIQAAKAPEANDSPAVGEAKPFLALGAGPIDQVRVEQRQSVRQSVTPH